MKNVAQRYSNLQEKMKEESMKLQNSIKYFKGMKKMYAKDISMLRRPPSQLSPTPGSPMQNRMLIRQLEGVIKKIDDRIESIQNRQREMGKRYSMIKRKTILSMANNLSRRH